MKRIVKIQNVGNVAFPDHMTDAEVRHAAAKLHSQANPQQPPLAKQPVKQWEPGEDDPVVRIETSDGKRWHVHLDDLAELQRRDPKAKIIQNDEE